MGPLESDPIDSDKARSEQPGQRLVRLGVLLYAGMAGVALVWRVFIQGEPMFFVSTSVQDQGWMLWRDGALGVGAGLGVVLLSDLLTTRTQWGEALSRRLAQAVGPLTWSQCIVLALVSGLGEEMFFRGALQPAVGLGWASLLFGLMHFAPERALLPWTGFAAVMGVVFGLLYLGTGNLLAPILAHGVINGVNLPRLVRRHAQEA